MSCTTIREILVNAEKEFGKEDAIRFKLKKDEVGAKTYTQLKSDSESFSKVLLSLGEQGSHIAITGMTSYEWIVSYLGTVNSESVAVPLDVSLPADELCELINRADATVLVFDEIRKDVASLALEKCPRLKHIISMQKETGDDKIKSFWELVKENQGSFDHMPKPDSLCTIMFTSGTTG
ncbi:MAG: AMP-binding protein, partial [Ruminococcus sp.]